MKPPARPRIVKPHLVWRWKRGAWRPSHRITWTENGARKAREIALDWKGDPAELDRLYWQAQRGAHEAQAKPAKHTWRECVIAWRNDDRAGQGKLSASTRASYRRAMDLLLEKNADKPMKATDRAAVKAGLDRHKATPRKAARIAQTIGILWRYAVEELHWPLPVNPAQGLAQHKPARPFLAWPDWMVEKLDAAPDRVRVACRLILYTGQRPSAAIGMRWDQIDGDAMTVTDEKGDKEWQVYCPEGMRTMLAGTPRQGAHILARNLTEPETYGAIAAAFERWRKGLGERAKAYSLHGLRKLATVELALAGATDAEIQAITGQSAKIVAEYRREADKRRLSRTAQQRRERKV